MEIRAVAAGRQTGWTPCAVHNGGCTHLCLFRQMSYVCACPDIPDEKQCYTGTTNVSLNFCLSVMFINVTTSSSVMRIEGNLNKLKVNIIIGKLLHILGHFPLSINLKTHVSETLCFCHQVKTTT
jgi:hypothetical protein